MAKNAIWDIFKIQILVPHISLHHKHGLSSSKNKHDITINPVNVTFALKCHAGNHHQQNQALYEFLNFSSKV
jgi:hypothetical protein